jgi:hypothetical protein
VAHSLAGEKAASAHSPSGATRGRTRLRVTNGVHSHHDHQKKLRNSFSIHDDAHLGVFAVVADFSRRSRLTWEHFDDDAMVVAQRQRSPKTARGAR